MNTQLLFRLLLFLGGGGEFFDAVDVMGVSVLSLSRQEAMDVCRWSLMKLTISSPNEVCISIVSSGWIVVIYQIWFKEALQSVGLFGLVRLTTE